MSDHWEIKQSWLNYCKDEGVDFDPIKTTIGGIRDHIYEECKAYRALIGGAYPDNHPDCVSFTEPEVDEFGTDGGMFMIIDLPDGTTVSVTVVMEKD